jgi:hypothetical protein
MNKHVKTITIKIDDRPFHIDIDNEVGLIIGSFEDQWFFNIREVTNNVYLHFDKTDNSIIGFTLMDIAGALTEIKELLTDNTNG